MEQRRRMLLHFPFLFLSASGFCKTFTRVSICPFVCTDSHTALLPFARSSDTGSYTHTMYVCACVCTCANWDIFSCQVLLSLEYRGFYWEKKGGQKIDSRHRGLLCFYNKQLMQQRFEAPSDNCVCISPSHGASGWQCALPIHVFILLLESFSEIYIHRVSPSVLNIPKTLQRKQTVRQVTWNNKLGKNKRAELKIKTEKQGEKK